MSPNIYSKIHFNFLKKKCWSFHTIHLIIMFLQTLPCFRQKTLRILSTTSNPFHLTRHNICKQVNICIIVINFCQLPIPSYVTFLEYLNHMLCGLQRTNSKTCEGNVDNNSWRNILPHPHYAQIFLTTIFQF